MMRKGHRRLVWFAAGCVVVLMATSAFFALRGSRHGRAVSSLAKCLPIIAKLRVTDFRNQDWCKNFAYSGGKFSNNNKASNCILFSGQGLAFSANAQRDFEGVAAEASRRGVVWFHAEFSDAGSVKEVTFSCSRFFTRQSYVYSPGYGFLPPDSPRNTLHTRIDKDWYYVWEDWN
jgi:hypothetical protein